MPIIQEGVFEIPFAVDFSPEEYSEVLEEEKILPLTLWRNV